MKRVSSNSKRLSYGHPSYGPSPLQQLTQAVLLFCCIIWLLMVYKVFLKEDWRMNNEIDKYINDNYQKLGLPEEELFSPGLSANSKIHILASKKQPLDRRDPQINDRSLHVLQFEKHPLLLPGGRREEITEPRHSTVIPIEIFSQKLLDWPPLTENGSIPNGEGVDIMPLTGLKVPRFWEAPPDTDINKIGSKVNGYETIFLMIASYRDFQCRETIASALSRADHPERIFVGAVDQIVPGDIGCLDIEKPCSVDPEQPACKYRNQISVYKMDAKYATGPVTARHIGDRLYRGQYFVMQMDAHCLFVRHWDTKLIDQWRSTKNEMAVMSSYLTDVQKSIDANGDSTRKTRPIMCNSDFEGNMPARYLRHGAQPEDEAVIRDMPQLQPFWAAGFSFSRGHFKYRVPYDGYQPMVFQGEEINVGIRGFTHGYDFYAPRDSVVFHEYAVKSQRRGAVHMFWENGGMHIGETEKSYRRATGIIGMAPDMDASSWDHTEEERYGLGKVRPLSLFYEVFLIDPVRRVAVQLCPFVRLGVMHQTFQAHLRPDGLGIDYNSSAVKQCNVREIVRKYFTDQIKFQEDSLRRVVTAVSNHGELGSFAKNQLTGAIAPAERIGLHANTSSILREAQTLLYGHPILY